MAWQPLTAPPGPALNGTETKSAGGPQTLDIFLVSIRKGNKNRQRVLHVRHQTGSLISVSGESRALKPHPPPGEAPLQASGRGRRLWGTRGTDGLCVP